MIYSERDSAFTKIAKQSCSSCISSCVFCRVKAPFLNGALSCNIRMFFHSVESRFSIDGTGARHRYRSSALYQKNSRSGIHKNNLAKLHFSTSTGYGSFFPQEASRRSCTFRNAKKVLPILIPLSARYRTKPFSSQKNFSFTLQERYLTTSKDKPYHPKSPLAQ